MKRISKAALAAMLAVGMGTVVVTPVIAKDKQAKQPELKLGDAFRNTAAPAQKALASGDMAAAETAVAAAEAAASSDDEKYVAAELRLQLLSKQNATPSNDPAVIAKTNQSYKGPIDVLLNNPRTPTDQRAKLATARGQIAFGDKDYAGAIKYYTIAQQAGASSDDISLALAQAKVKTGDIAGGVAGLDQIVKADEAKGQKAPEDLYKYAVSNLYKTNDRATTLDWVKRWLAAYPTTENWRNAIIVFGFQGPTAAQMSKANKVDLYRLMRATGSLADRGDFLEYAQDAIDLGLPDEAKTVIEQGRASGKLPASDSNAKAIASAADRAIAAQGSLGSLATKAKASAKGDLAQQTADAYLGKADYATAIELYNLALQKGVTHADETNMHLGIAEAMSGNTAGAMAPLNAVQSSPNKDVASLWLAYLAGKSSPSAATTPAAPAAS